MRLLIVKTSSLGDIVQAFPTLQFLKAALPLAEIDWIVEKPFASLVRAHSLVSTVFEIDTKKWRQGFYKLAVWSEMRALKQAMRDRRYNALFDLQGNIKSALIISQLKALQKVGFGYKTVHEKPNCLFTDVRFNPPKGLNIREDYLFLAKSYIKSKFVFEDPGIRLKISAEEDALLDKLLKNPKLQNGPRIMICPGSAWRNKQLPVPFLKEFLTHFQHKTNSSFLFVWGSPDEKALAESLNKDHESHSIVVDKMPLPMLQNLMARVDLVFAMDSLALHLAGTTKTPSFSVFGPSSAIKFKPEGKRHWALQGACPYGRTFEKRCPILRTCPTGACMSHYEGAELAAALFEFVEKCK